MAIAYYSYKDWTEWPESDVLEYVSEIAAEHRLTGAETRHLKREMLSRAGHDGFRRPSPFGPFKLSQELEEAMCELGDEVQVDTLNRRLNRPYKPRQHNLEFRTRSVGRGLSRRHFTEIANETVQDQKIRRQHRKEFARRPFSTMSDAVRRLTSDALWHADCYSISQTDWIIRKGHDAPFTGMVWYAFEIERTFENAKAQIDVGNIEAAAAHGYKVGTLMAELGMLLAHGTIFEKYEAVSISQRDAGKARKQVSDEARQAAYWRFRQAGHKRIEAGRLAASELHLSEPSIRNAFPGGRYPRD